MSTFYQKVMAKKKKNKQQSGQQSLSPGRFIRERIRNVKIGKCYMSEDFDDGEGLGYVIVTREHTGGRISVGVFLIDTWCIGVKGSFYRLRVDENNVDELLGYVRMAGDVKQVSYNEAHNMVWGAVAFGEEAGIEPDKDFALTQYFLEEDTDDIPLIEYDYGHEGKHYLVAKSNLELTTYLPILKKNLNEGLYDFVVKADDDLDDEDDWDDGYPQDEESPYYEYDGFPHTYRGSYPTAEEKPAFPEVTEALSAPDNNLSLPDNTVDHLLELPHDALRHQLEQTILYGLGQLQLYEGELDEKAGTVGQLIIHGIILLGDLEGGEESLKVVLEALRQPDDPTDFIFGDCAYLTAVPTIAKLGTDLLPLLKSFIFEEGILHHVKSHVFEAVADMALLHPEKREEIISWFGSIIDRINEEGTDAHFTDATLNGLLISELLDLRTEELLPKIKEMYDKGLVNQRCCGRWETVEHDMKSDTYHGEEPITNIKQIYKELSKFC